MGSSKRAQRVDDVAASLAGRSSTHSTAAIHNKPHYRRPEPHGLGAACLSISLAAK